MSLSVKLRLALVLLCVLGLCLGVSGCGEKAQMEAPELLEPRGVTLDTVPAQRGTIWCTTVLEGLVLPGVRELSFEASGSILEVTVCAGSRVKEGDVLATLDVSYLESALEAQKSYLAYREEQERITERELEIQLELARLALEEQRQAGADSTALRLLELDVEARRGDLSETRALWELDHGDMLRSIEEMESAVSAKNLLAPCDGTVVTCTAADGGYAIANAPVIWLAEDEALYLSVPAVSAALLSEADEVYASVGGNRMAVEAIDAPGEEYILREGMSAFAVTDAGGEAVEAGMTALIFIISQRTEDAIIIPAAALRSDSGYFVYVIENGAQVRRSVQPGVVNDAEVQILSGLQEGEVVYAGN